MNELIYNFGHFTDSVPVELMVVIIISLMIWSTVWKGIALWKAARLSHKGWFVALLIVNTIGILEIAYIFLVAKKAEVEGKSA
ncbi:MAG TPA: DUF5652 family protein [Candidatus Paceibacterota bacterium]|nr:DUF5652 family protein [Candidatus Paceibacterota bacterium]